MRISDWSSDVCSSDLAELEAAEARLGALEGSGIEQAREGVRLAELSYRAGKSSLVEYIDAQQAYAATQAELIAAQQARAEARAVLARQAAADGRSEEHTSEIKSLMRISYAVICLKKKIHKYTIRNDAST